GYSEIGLTVVMRSRYRLEVLDLRHSPAEFLLDAHEDGHDGAGAAAAHAVEADLGHAIGAIDHFDVAAVHLQGRADFFVQDAGHALLEVVRACRRHGNPLLKSSSRRSAGPAPHRAVIAGPGARRSRKAEC